MNQLRSRLNSNIIKSIILSCAAAGPVSVLAEVLPRDLDGDPSTVEAYYDTDFDITVVAHPNLPLTETFGIERAVASDCTDGIFCFETLPGIDRYGFVEWPTADNYISAMNAAGFMGHSSWRLPTTSFIPNNAFGFLGGPHELDEVIGSRFTMYLPTYDIANYRFVTDTYHPDGGRAYIRDGSTTHLGTGLSDGLTRFAVWPVHDGDIGGEVDPGAQQFCADFDGDGFGWDGTMSCEHQNYSLYAEAIEPLEPRDLDGDTTTTEAYYHPQLEMTWLANSRIAGSQRAGVTGNINADGSFNSVFTASVWIRQLNQTNYLGHNQWRLPEARNTFEFQFSTPRYDTEVEVLGENLTRLTSDSGINFELLEGTYLLSSDSFSTGITVTRRDNRVFTFADNISFRDDFFAWPVHDGDIGTPLNVDPPCIDTDGDGWGWTGTDSCVVDPAL